MKLYLHKKKQRFRNEDIRFVLTHSSGEPVPMAWSSAFTAFYPQDYLLRCCRCQAL